MMAKNLMVIDTDCGVDDALALLMAITHLNKWDILAITTCTGNTSLENTSKNVLRVLENFGQKIPVYKGCDRPLVAHSNQATHFEEDGFGGVSSQFPTGDLEVDTTSHATTILIDTAKNYPGQVTLVALGPLTNLAVALRLDPQFSHNLKELVIMGGNTQGRGNMLPASEFNFGFDPEAAHIVLRESACPVTIVPYETCVKHALPWPWYDRWLQVETAKSHFTRTILEQHVHRSQKELNRPKFCCCDLVAMSCVLYPELITEKKEYRAYVELQGKYTRGMLVLDRRPINVDTSAPNITIVKTLNTELLQDLYIKLLVQ